MYICQSQSPNSSSHPPIPPPLPLATFPPWCPCVCSLHLSLYFCPANWFIPLDRFLRGSWALGSSGISMGVLSPCLLARMRTELSLLAWPDRNLQELVQAALGCVCVSVDIPESKDSCSPFISAPQACGYSPPFASSPGPQIRSWRLAQVESSVHSGPISSSQGLEEVTWLGCSLCRSVAGQISFFKGDNFIYLFIYLYLFSLLRVSCRSRDLCCSTQALSCVIRTLS